MLQLILTIAFYGWLGAVLMLLWRHALGGGKHVNRLYLLLNKNTEKSVEAANKSAEAAIIAAEAARKLAALLESKHDA